MRPALKFLLWISVFGLLILPATAQLSQCPARPGAGSVVAEPPAYASENGVVHANITVRSTVDPDGNVRYCFVSPIGEAPTIRANPGDQVDIQLTNRITATAAGVHSHPMPVSNPCSGRTMSVTSTNLHFHGLNISPKCHEDDVLRTVVNNTDPPFLYRFRIPENEPPGVYWYHPHMHSLTMPQIMGGASGAIIVEGIEQIKPEVIGLQQRVFIIRDQLIAAGGGGGDNDLSSLSLNFVPATYPNTLPPQINMAPGEKQFWRVLNAAGEHFMNLQLWIDGVAEDLQVISLDGTPQKRNVVQKTITIPPSGRAEFIVTGPELGHSAQFITNGIFSGIDGDPNPKQIIAFVNPTGTSQPHTQVASAKLEGARRFSDLENRKAVVQRSLYFSEDLTDQNNPKFFLTVDGQTPKLFDPSDPPAIVTTQGAVEEWTIENRSGEIHAFHMHQIHFVVEDVNGQPVKEKKIQDTVVVQPWDKVSSTYPSVKLLMDFRYPENVGTFVYHCHILDHEDGGMMAKIQVNPAPK
ncbi:MAG TPA: multicopper oxidase domain-containing protein [Terriglobales bacterium]|jgi:FtsP/CotA-like multicopper oxidase with cupredoxin domain